MPKKETERERLMQEAREARAAAGMNTKRTFSEWFENSFRPHFMWPSIIALAAIAFVIFLCADFIGEKDPDFTLTIATVGLFREEDAAELKSLIEETVGDVNGDGEVNVVLDIYITSVSVDTSTDQLGSGATGTNAVSGTGGNSDVLQAFDITFMAEEKNVLYLLDDTMISRYDEDYFEYLSDYGFETESAVFYPANGIPIMDRLLASDDIHFWFCLRGWRDTKRDDPEYIEVYDTAVKVLNAIIAAE